MESLCSDPYALETVCVSIITYNTAAEQIVPLTEAYKLRIPNIEAKGRSALGEALQLLVDRINVEVQKTTPEIKGDWKPLFFLLSDGGHNGPLAKPIAELKKLKFGMMVACAAGVNSHIDILRKITDNVVQISTTESVNIASFFKWVSSSISASSVKVNDTEDRMTVNDLPPLPKELKVLRFNTITETES